MSVVMTTLSGKRELASSTKETYSHRSRNFPAVGLPEPELVLELLELLSPVGSPGPPLTVTTPPPLLLMLLPLPLPLLELELPASCLQERALPSSPEGGGRSDH
jgi:hypothetical protein